jgi:hypothetical protein
MTHSVAESVTPISVDSRDSASIGHILVSQTRYTKPPICSAWCDQCKPNKKCRSREAVCTALEGQRERFKRRGGEEELKLATSVICTAFRHEDMHVGKQNRDGVARMLSM